MNTFKQKFQLILGSKHTLAGHYTSLPPTQHSAASSRLNRFLHYNARAMSGWTNTNDFPGSSSSSRRDIESRSLTTTNIDPNAISNIQPTSPTAKPLKVIFVLGGPGEVKSNHLQACHQQTQRD